MSTQKRLLVVDDVADVRESLALMLEDDGYLVHRAKDGMDAMTVIRSHPIDLLISDIRMPGMDGISLSIEAKTLLPELIVILISGGGKHFYEDRELDIGEITQVVDSVHYALKKPLHPMEFINLIEKIFL